MRAGAVPVRVFDPTKMTADNADGADTRGGLQVCSQRHRSSKRGTPDLRACVYATQSIYIIRVIRSESLPRARRGGPRPCFWPDEKAADNADAADTVGSVMCLLVKQPLSMSLFEISAAGSLAWQMDGCNDADPKHIPGYVGDRKRRRRPFAAPRRCRRRFQTGLLPISQRIRTLYIGIGTYAKGADDAELAPR